MQQKFDDVLNRINSGHRLAQLAISSTGFVFDPQTGQSFTLNHSGLAALESLKRDGSPEQTARLLAQTYDVPFEVAETSVHAFLMQLGRYL